MMTENNSVRLPNDICEHIDRWILRYPKEHKRSGVFEALRVVQERNGYLTEEWMNAVADYLGMPRIAVYEIATFYTMYYLHPVGKHVINVCTNVPCSLRGANDIVAHIKARLQIDFNETTPDGKFTLKEAECLGACVNAPVCQVGKKYYEHLTNEKIDEMLSMLNQQSENRHGK